jgi:hypothetical protein
MGCSLQNCLSTLAAARELGKATELCAQRDWVWAIAAERRLGITGDLGECDF